MKWMASFAVVISLVVSGCVVQPLDGSGGVLVRPGPKPLPEPAPGPAPRKLVKSLDYDGGRISYFMTKQSVPSNRMRLCLVNNTGQPKQLVWTKVQSGVNNMVTRRNGDRSCVNLDLNQRIEFVFIDRLVPRKNSGMNLQSFGGALVEFYWVKDY